MKNTIIENRISEIVALEPCYGPRGGNAVRIFTREGGSFEVEMRMSSLLKNICACLNADLAIMRKNYGDYLGCRQYIPLPLAPNFVLIPIKMRRPGCENDGATGYISLFDMVRIVEPGSGEGYEEARCLIHLAGGHVLPSLFSHQNTQKRVANARVALDRFLALQNRAGSNSALLRGLEEMLKEEGLEGLLKKIIMLALKPEPGN